MYSDVSQNCHALIYQVLFKYGGSSKNKRGISLLLEDEEVQNPRMFHFGMGALQASKKHIPSLDYLYLNLILWPPDANSRFIGKDPDTGKDWRQKEKCVAEDEMVGWHHWLNGHEFEQTLGDGEGQRNLACCSPWGRKESDTLQLNNSSLDYLKEFKAKKRVLTRYLLAPLFWTSQLSEPWKINVFFWTT